MKLRNLLIPALLAFAVTACNDEEAKSYDGAIFSDGDSTITFAKIKGAEYKMTYKSKLVDTNNSVLIKDGRVYNNNNSFLGDISDSSYKTIDGIVYTR